MHEILFLFLLLSLSLFLDNNVQNRKISNFNWKIEKKNIIKSNCLLPIGSYLL